MSNYCYSVVKSQNKRKNCFCKSSLFSGLHCRCKQLQTNTVCECIGEKGPASGDAADEESIQTGD